jgi:hypothetical protein
MIQAEKGKRPVIVLDQRSLQWAFGDRAAGIRNNQDAQRIQRGANVIYLNRPISSMAASTSALPASGARLELRTS